MSLHVVRNGILTVVQCVLQVLFILWLVVDVVGSDAFWYARREVVVADVEAHNRFRHGVVRGSALNVLADKGSSSLVSAARVPPDTTGTS